MFYFFNVNKILNFNLMVKKKDFLLIKIKGTNKTTGPCENQSFVKKRPFCPRVNIIHI